MKKATLWLITAKTNLHVGNENTTNYGIIDNAIQRSVLTGLPCINSSSLKGAINEFITTECPEITEHERIQIFGSDKKGKNSDVQKGEAMFFDAHLLKLPVPGENCLYKLHSSEGVKKLLVEQMTTFGMGEKQVEIDTWLKGCVVDSDSEFKELCDDESLPIIARNKLDNGESKNLWYEQVLPAETALYAIILTENEKLVKALDKAIVQIGANATIGYGYCEFKKIV